MARKANKNLSIRITDRARERLDSLVNQLRERPPVPELGRATIGSVISAAVMEGLEVLAERYGLNGNSSESTDSTKKVPRIAPVAPRPGPGIPRGIRSSGRGDRERDDLELFDPDGPDGPGAA